MQIITIFSEITGDLTFTNKAEAWGLGKRSFSNGGTYADLDNDGDLDLVVNNINNPAYIFRNNSDKKPDNHFLGVKFTGTCLNTRGIGARVTLFCAGNKQVAEQFPTRGFLSATSDVLHFGVGTGKNDRFADRSLARQVSTNHHPYSG